MFTASTVEHNQVLVLKIEVPEIVSGSATEVFGQLSQALQAERLIVDWSALKSMESDAGMGFVMLWQQRGHSVKRTKNFGLADDVKKAYWATTFMFLEQKEIAADEESALEFVTQSN